MLAGKVLKLMSQIWTVFDVELIHVRTCKRVIKVREYYFKKVKKANKKQK